jgi:uncharacterized protein YcnI
VLPHARTWRRAVVGALAATLLLALPAGAHPFIRGGEAPVDSIATVALAMGHGCGTEDSGGGDPTLEIALEVPEEVRIVEVADDPSYDHEFEATDDGRIEIITWTAIAEGEPAPDVEFDAVFAGEPGDEVYLRVFQGCDDFAYRWIGTPDDPADDPAVRVTLVAADADRPAPAPDERTPAEEEAAPEPEVVEDDGPSGEPTDESTDDATDEVEDDTTAQDGTAEGTVGDVAVEDAADETGGGFPVWLIVVVVAIAGIGIAVAQRVRGGGTDHGGTATR